MKLVAVKKLHLKRRGLVKTIGPLRNTTITMGVTFYLNGDKGNNSERPINCKEP
jgi:hypothetical protein